MDSGAKQTERELSVAGRVALALALLWPWLFVWQGIDVTDQGYLLTIYRQFLHHPEAVSQAAHMWLTNTLGGLWDAVFGGLGVFAHRAQWATCVSLGMLIAFTAIRRLTEGRVAAISVLAAVVFLCNRRETWFSYNSLTALINAGALALMLRGLTENNRRLLFASGVLLGMSPFGRLPSVAGLALLSGPMFWSFVVPEHRKALVRDSIVATAGVMTGAAVLLGCMAIDGSFHVYLASVRALFAPAVAKTGHGTSALLQQFIDDQGAALLAGAAAGGLLTALYFATRRLPGRYRLPILAVAVALAARMLVYTGSGRDPEHWRYYLLGTCYAGLGAMACGVGRRSQALRLAAYLSIVALVVTPFGSDQGTLNAHWGMWVPLPLLLASLLSFDKTRPPRELRDLGLALAALIVIEGIARAKVYTYRDAPREELRHAVSDRQLRFQFTTQPRAQALTEATQALRARVSPGDYLLTSESVPLFQYLSSTRPYLSIPWIMVDEDLEDIRSRLARAPAEKGCLPVLIRARGNARNRAWPLDGRRVDRKHAPARKIIAGFLRAHGYERTWSNSFFEILEPQAPSPHGIRHCR